MITCRDMDLGSVCVTSMTNSKSPAPLPTSSEDLNSATSMVFLPPLLRMFSIYVIIQSLLISTPDMLLQSEKVRHHPVFFCSLFHIIIILCIIPNHTLQKGRKSIGRSQSFLGTGVSEERRRHNSLKVTEATNGADDILLICDL